MQTADEQLVSVGRWSVGHSEAGKRDGCFGQGLARDTTTDWKTGSGWLKDLIEELPPIC